MFLNWRHSALVVLLALIIGFTVSSGSLPPPASRPQPILLRAVLKDKDPSPLPLPSLPLVAIIGRIGLLRHLPAGPRGPQVEDDTDVMWAEYGPDSREGVAQIQERAVRFLKWLEARLLPPPSPSCLLPSVLPSHHQGNASPTLLLSCSLVEICSLSRSAVSRLLSVCLVPGHLLLPP